MDWTEEDFPDDPPTTIHRADIITSNSDPDYHPDLAWDAETGYLHVAWTGHTDEANHPYRVKYRSWSRPSPGWGSTFTVCESDKDYAGWMPRIAVGNSGFSGFDDVVGIVYSAYSDQANHYHQGLWHIGGALWDVDTQDPDDAVFFHTAYLSDYDAGFPRVDLAPRSSGGTGYGSIVFSQHYGTDGSGHEMFHVIERNNVRNDWWPIENGSDEGFFGAVSIHPGHSPAEASLSYFEWDEAEDDWTVTAGRYLLGTQSPAPSWPDIGVDIQGGELTYGDFSDFLEIETFQAGDIVTISSGSYDNAYWIGYCDYIDSQAHTVNVAYGDTT